MADSRGEKTRQRYLDVAEKLFCQQGYHGTGLGQIIEQASGSKGSFYFHFASKEALAVAVLDRAVTSMVTTNLESAAARAADPLQRVIQLIDVVLDQQAEQELPADVVGLMAMELAPQSDAIRQITSMAFADLRDALTKWLEAAKNKRRAYGVDSGAVATFVVGSLQGAILLARAEGDLFAARRCLAGLAHYLRKILG